MNNALKLVIVGHVDHGKSTLIGRLLHDTNSLPEGKYEALKAVCDRRGMPFEFAFLLDALQAERDQGITIDTTQIWFRTKRRDVVIIDAPGHKEFLKNMVTGAAQADAATLVIDAKEGLRDQTHRHAYLVNLIGVQQTVVVVNKMDSVNFSETRFREIDEEVRRYFAGFGKTPVCIIPLSARAGDNVVTLSDRMGWYKGPTLSEAIDSMEAIGAPADQPFRMIVQDIYKFDERRIVVGRVESGRLRVGDRVLFSPQNISAGIKTIEAWPVGARQPSSVVAGESIGVTLDDQIFVERGAMVSHLDNLPIETDVFNAQIFYLGRRPLHRGQSWTLKIGSAECEAVVQSVHSVVDSTDLSVSNSTDVQSGDTAHITMRTRRIMALDPYLKLPRTGRFVISGTDGIAGGGTISMDGYADQRNSAVRRSTNVTVVEHRVNPELRVARNGHSGAVVWFTGLSGAGKSTLAVELENRLFAMGYQVYLLDGDNLRHGLCADLGFTPEERAENIRRAGEMAALMSDAGFVVLTAFISPYQSDRVRARNAAKSPFFEIYVAADIETCAQRDPKGLYRKAREGLIPNFTGVSAPYEEPENPDLIVRTDRDDVETCVLKALDLVRHGIPIRSRA